MKRGFGARRNRISIGRKTSRSASTEAGSKQTSSLKLRTILVPVDFSKRSLAALNYADMLTRSFGGSVMLLHVLDPILTAGRLESARLRQLKASSRREAAEQLRAVRRKLVQKGVPTQRFLRHGPAADTIVAFAGKTKADLIVIGSQGRTGLKRLLIGSVAERVVRHALCPVLVAR
jgi:universal stress protein A